MIASIDNVFEIEDWLNEKGVFVNGITGKAAHRDSYMTILDYDKFVSAYKEGKYTDEQWRICVDYWLGVETFTPVLKLMAKELNRQMVKNQQATSSEAIIVRNLL